MASIGLGWIGEPAIAEFLMPAVAFLPASVAEATAHSVAVAAAFAMGAAYVLVGSVHQACVESGTSDIVRAMLAQQLGLGTTLLQLLAKNLMV